MSERYHDPASASSTGAPAPAPAAAGGDSQPAAPRSSFPSTAASARAASSSSVRLASSTAAGSSNTPLLAPITASTASSTRSRHSLYGVEDRAVLDLGSRVWKVGFSGESAPRAVFDLGESIWDNEYKGRSSTAGSADEIARWASIERSVKHWLRKVFYDELMVDSKTRKVIVLENPMLPIRIKHIIASTLLEHLQVPSLSFALTPLCALLSIGRITGLVLDVGNLETCILPIYSSRPLFGQLRTTPLGSAYLTRHLRALLQRFSIYKSYASATTARSSSTRRIVSPVPHEVLTDAIVEEIKTRICFVEPETPDDNSNSVAKVSTSKGSYYINRELYSPPTSSTSSAGSEEEALETDYIRHVQDVLKSRHSRPGSRNTPTSSDVSIRLKNGTLSVPGWLRHACTDVFFDSDWDVDLPSLPELVLDCILKLPIDLRKPFMSSILLVGGGSMLPGFPLRLASSIHTLLHRDNRYTSLRGLSRFINIVNTGGVEHSTPTDGQAAASGQADDPQRAYQESVGQAADFCWERSLLAWVGASLVGAMKASGVEEWTRESWDSANAHQRRSGTSSRVSKSQRTQVGDWTRTKLS